jgi:hypothetical protein
VETSPFQWLEDTGQINGNYLNNIRCDTGRHFKNREKNIQKPTLMVQYISYVGFEVFMAVTMKNTILFSTSTVHRLQESIKFSLEGSIMQYFYGVWNTHKTS